MTDQVEVWLDADFLERTRVGTLTHARADVELTAAAFSESDAVSS
jgi:hypothetical protein